MPVAEADMPEEELAALKEGESESGGEDAAPAEPSGWGLSDLHCLQTRRWRRCSQIPEPRQSLHSRRSRRCSQIAEPPHSLQRLRRRMCRQICTPPHSLQRLLRRLCSQIWDPLHSMQSATCRW